MFSWNVPGPSYMLIPAAQGSVLIFPDFHWPALFTMHLAVFKYKYSLGLEEQIPRKCLSTYMHGWCKAKTGAKIGECLEAGRGRVKSCCRQHVERETLSGAHALPSAVLSSCSSGSPGALWYWGNGAEALTDVFGAQNLTHCFPVLCFAHHTWKMAL